MPPRSGNQIAIPTKFPSQTVARMDEMIASGRYSSRSHLVKEAVDRLLNEDRYREEIDHLVEDIIMSGRADVAIEDRMRLIFAGVIRPPETDSPKD